MANDYYNHGGYPSFKSCGDSAPARAEFDAVSAGFDKLPGKHSTRPGFTDPIEVGAAVLSTQAAQLGQVSSAVSGYLPLGGGTLTGNLTINNTNPFLEVRTSADGQQGGVVARRNGDPMWTMSLGDTTANRDFRLIRHDNSGSAVGTPIIVERLTGQTHFNISATGSGVATSFQSDHNSEQSLTMYNMSAGAGAYSSIYSVTDAGYASILVSSSAAGATALIYSNVANGVTMGASHASGVLHLMAKGAARVDVSDTTVNMLAGSGSLRMAGHITRYEAPAENMITGQGVYTLRSPGSTLRPDIMQVWLKNVTAQNGYTTGDCVVVSPTYCQAFWDGDTNQIRVLQNATPQQFNATTGALAACTPANWQVVLVAIWL